MTFQWLFLLVDINLVGLGVGVAVGVEMEVDPVHEWIRCNGILLTDILLDPFIFVFVCFYVFIDTRYL